MTIDKYNKYLLDTITEITILCTLIIIIAIIFIVFLRSAIRNRKKEDIIVHSLILGIICFAVIGSIIYVVPFVLDVCDQSYVKYEGEYVVESFRDTGVAGANSHVRISDEEKSRQYDFRPNPDYWTEGVYNGYIVYSKRSKVIVEWGGEKIESNTLS